MTFGAHNLFIPIRFWTTCTKFDNCCQRYITSGGKIHIESTFSALNYCSGIIFLNLSAIYTKWCAQPFPPIFGLFAILYLNFAKIVAPPSNKNENYVVQLTEQPILKKRWKPHQNRPINCHTLLVWTVPSRRQMKRHIQKTPIFAPTAGA